MGTLLGHVVPGLAFTMLGLWHTLNTTKSYNLNGPSTFSSTTWFPSSTLKHLELYLLISFGLLAAVLQLLDYPRFAFSFQPNNFEHATMFLHVIIYASVALAADSASPSHAGLVGALAASVFGQEFFLLHYHSADHTGLEGHYHWLLQLIVAASALATVMTTGFPGSFVATLVRSVSVLFQGVWFIVMGLVLWVPALVPKGCYAVSSPERGRGAVACHTEEASMRAVTLANMQHSWTLAVICIFVAYLCLRPMPSVKSPQKYRKLEEPPVGTLEISHEYSVSEQLKQVPGAF
ncbi:transmembrane protein 45A-like [Zingiber officinale]|uniref:Uncharacterized protein n=1 Tax=Zingiber officinale TaxID=94328 RepID=A0A8J5LLY9_ZINOF|nr:transmembrane protein 45A-like [Zingiber officinale]KAG6521159.1 hypothetical protein ZIOFF_018225 [Zingiber officinale]